MIFSVKLFYNFTILPNKFKGKEKLKNMPVFQITLKSARTNLGLTLKESAKLLDIHHITLGKYENDSTNVTRSFIIKIEKVYGIPSEFIFFGKEDDFINGKRNELNIDLKQLA